MSSAVSSCIGSHELHAWMLIEAFFPSPHRMDREAFFNMLKLFLGVRSRTFSVCQNRKNFVCSLRME